MDIKNQMITAVTVASTMFGQTSCTEKSSLIGESDAATPTEKVVDTTNASAASVFDDTDAEWNYFLKEKSSQNQQANNQSKTKQSQENADNRTTEVTGDTTRINDGVNSLNIKWDKINTKILDIGGRRPFVQELQKLGKNVKIIITDSKEYKDWKDVIGFCMKNRIQIMTPKEYKRMLTENRISATLRETSTRDHEAALTSMLSKNGRGGRNKAGELTYSLSKEGITAKLHFTA